MPNFQHGETLREEPSWKTLQFTHQSTCVSMPCLCSKFVMLTVASLHECLVANHFFANWQTHPQIDNSNHRYPHQKNSNTPINREHKTQIFT